MRAVSPGRAAVQDMDTDHGRLYVAMAQKLLDRADIVAPSGGCVADKGQLRVRTGPQGFASDRSALWLTAAKTSSSVHSEPPS